MTLNYECSLLKEVQKCLDTACSHTNETCSEFLYCLPQCSKAFIYILNFEDPKEKEKNKLFACIALSDFHAHAEDPEYLILET